MCRWWATLAVATFLSGPGTGAAAAQAPDPHVVLPERPSVATHAHTVAPGWVEAELGYQGDREAGRFGDRSLPMVLKVGLQRRLQLTAATSIVRPAGRAGSTIDEVNLGVKWRVRDRMPVAGDVAILPSISVSTTTGTRAAAGVLLIASRTLGPLSLDVNAGYTRHAGDGSLSPKSESIWAAALGGPVAGRFGWLGELSGSPSTSGPAGHANTVNTLWGATASLRPSFMVDVAVSLPISGSDPSSIMTGVVWNAGRLRARP
jgi:hypothetical protein